MPTVILILLVETLNTLCMLKGKYFQQSVKIMGNIYFYTEKEEYSLRTMQRYNRLFHGLDITQDTVKPLCFYNSHNNLKRCNKLVLSVILWFRNRPYCTEWPFPNDKLRNWNKTLHYGHTDKFFEWDTCLLTIWHFFKGRKGRKVSQENVSLINTQ